MTKTRPFDPAEDFAREMDAIARQQVHIAVELVASGQSAQSIAPSADLTLYQELARAGNLTK